MKKNVGIIDRTLRLIVGLGLIIQAIYFQTTAAIIAGILGGILLITAIIGYCPPYALLGISTCKKK